MVQIILNELYTLVRKEVNLELKIVRGKSALELLNDKAFILQWEGLSEQNGKTTIIQEPPFVLTWYRQYADRYEPVLILSFDDNSCLVGIMPLAFILKNNYLTHAGDGQAEYHGWICKKNVEKDFLVKALIAVKHNFRVGKWQWRWMPPGSETGWLYSEELKKEKIYVRVVEKESPVLNLNDEDKIEKLKRNKSIRNKINRYRGKANFYIERITSVENAGNVFDILSEQCDFRQMAAHEITPFASDQNKKRFYIERLKFPLNNHFTVLWSGSNPIAFHYGACDSDTVYLGLSSYDPVEERNSPGTILMIKLIELLKQEGYKYFDLTPGGDKYKERYCSFHRKLYLPSIYFSRKDKLIGDFRYFLKAGIRKLVISAGAEPADVNRRVRNAFSFLREIRGTSPLKIASKFISKFYEKVIYVSCRCFSDDLLQNDRRADAGINVNSYTDLMFYNGSDPWLRKSILLTTAIKRFSSGEKLYTMVRNGILVQYGWMARGGIENGFPDFKTGSDHSENGFILYDFFTEKGFKRKELISETLEKMLFDCRHDADKEVSVSYQSNDDHLGCELEKRGFRVYRKISITKVLGLVIRKSMDH